ncbi:MAG: shikimate kinase [Actinomycetota bacterium]|nr:shikimate kinase [Actinomycetota bacterium]
MTAGPLLVLVGAPGAGKSTVGILLAQHWGVGFAETDDDVVAAAGMPLQTVVVEAGEPTFRQFERDAVLARLADFDGVLAVGGGAVADDAVRAALRGRPVVWLRVTAPNAASRMGLNAVRPVALGNVRAQFAAQLKARAPLYDEVAMHIVDTDHRPVPEVAQELAALFPDVPAHHEAGELS